MRICFVSLTAYEYFASESTVTAGGAERQLYLLSQSFSSDVDVHFVVGDYGQEERLVKDGVTLHKAYDPNPDSTLRDQLTQFAALWRAMKRADADIYIFRGHPRKAAVTYLLAKLLGAKWVYNVANDSNISAQVDGLHRPFRTVFVGALRHADGLIAQTPHQRDRLLNRFGVDASVVPNGYPEAKDITPQSDRAYFLWVGRIEESQKCPDKYLDLAEELPENTFRLVGPRNESDPYHRQITERAASLGNVEDMGGVSPDQVHEHYRRAIALVNTSNHEGFPNTFLEAWRQRTAVVSLNVDPGRFIESDAHPGFAHGDEKQLRTILNQLSDDIQKRDRLAQVGYRYFRQHLRIDSVSNSYEQVLRDAFD